MQQFKCRASGSSNIMGVKGLGKIGLTFAENWYKEQLYERRQEFSSKYTEKGIEKEDGAIDLVADHFGYGLLTKNETWFENDFITGTPDIILGDRIIDIKCSWSAFTFPLFAKVEDTYDIQMQCYMALTDKSMAQVIYCLMDAPERLIDAEANKQARILGLDDVPVELFEKVKANMTYSNLPNKLRIKSFEIKRDDKLINLIYERVKECRTHLSGIDIAAKALPKYSKSATQPINPIHPPQPNLIGGLELNW